MEMTTMRAGRRSGWSEQEDNLLWETANEAQKNATPLKQVFDEIACKTGRRPNSIRNYYYAQAQKRNGGTRPQRFVPFEEEEVTSLLDRVLRARAQGRSVRSCLTELACGDHRLMLRYQNKYRSVLKSRPDLVKDMVDDLAEEGVDCHMTVPHIRQRVTPEEAAEKLQRAGQGSENAEIAAMCDTLCRLIFSNGRGTSDVDRLNVRMDLLRIAIDEKEARLRRMCEAGEALVREVKEWTILPESERSERAISASRTFVSLLGPLEACLTENAPKLPEKV